MQEAADQFREYSAIRLASGVGDSQDWEADQAFIRALEGEPLPAEIAKFAVERNLQLPDAEQPYWMAALVGFHGHHELSLDNVAEGIRRGYCTYPLMETDPLLAGVRADESVATEYARVRQAGKSCHDGFVAYIAGR